YRPEPRRAVPRVRCRLRRRPRKRSLHLLIAAQGAPGGIQAPGPRAGQRRPSQAIGGRIGIAATPGGGIEGPRDIARGAAMARGGWVYVGGRAGNKPSPGEKSVITAACEAFIADVLKPRFLPEIRPDQFNYPIAIYGKWLGNKYRFI